MGRKRKRRRRRRKRKLTYRQKIGKGGGDDDDDADDMERTGGVGGEAGGADPIQCTIKENISYVDVHT